MVAHLQGRLGADWIVNPVRIKSGRRRKVCRRKETTLQGRARDSCYFRQMIAGEPRDALRQWREVTRKLPLSPLLQGIIVMAEKKEISMLLACAICTQTVVVLKRHQQPAPVPIYQLTINKKNSR